jgi:peptidoglycan hydrolase-like protein with peptidoglycan-binding domain
MLKFYKFAGHGPVHGGHIGGHKYMWHRRGRRWQRLHQGGQPTPPAPDPQVQFAQSCLAQSDTSVPQDGILGPQTQQAIQTFQSQHQLPPTGALDSGTMTALQAACSGQSADQSGQPSPPQDGGQPPRPRHSQHESEQGEFPFGGLFSGLFGGNRDHRDNREHRFREERRREHREPWFAREIGSGEGEQGEFEPFDIHRDGGFREDGRRWRAERGRRWPWAQEAESPMYEEEEIRAERPIMRTTYLRPVEFRRVERPGVVERGRWDWDRARPGYVPRWEGRDWRNHVPGDRPQIVWAQSCLAQILGPWVLQDGVWGKNTADAIRMFQEQRQLPLTGVLDGDTVNALQAACGG